MNEKENLIDRLYQSADADPGILGDPEVAYVVLNHNTVVGMNGDDGLEVEVDERTDGIEAFMEVKEGAVIRKQVHLCFGMIPKEGVQNILMNVNVKRNARISVLAHCVFPNAVDVQHIMDAKIHIADGAEYTYLERHVHSPEGGIKVYPKAKGELGKKARFKTEFELIKGRVGLIDIDYETVCREHCVLEMTSRISGTEDDIIQIKEVGHLNGESARGALTTRIAVRRRAQASVYNKLTANAPFARGHVDCKEIVQEEATAATTPVVEVNHPKAHITHEAAIGSVDAKQPETLMSRGLSEDEAVELIIDGLLS